MASHSILVTSTAAQSVLILGGGPAGLTAAYRLAQRGRPVTLLDRASALGGNLAHERGLPKSLLGCHQATWRLLHELGSSSHPRAFQETALEFHLPDGRVVRYPHSRVPAPLYPVFTIGRFAGLSWNERWKLLSWLEAIWEGSEHLPSNLEHRTAQEWLTSLNYSQRVQRSIWSPAAQWLTGNDLSVLSADAFVAALTPFFLQRSSANRIVIVQQSWQTLLVTPILHTLEGQRHTISLETQAAQFHIEQDRISGVRLRDGSIRQADWYVAALPVSQLTPLIPERWLSRYAYFQQIGELESVSCVTMKVRTRQPLMRPRLVLLSDSPFRWLQVQGDESGHSEFSMVTTSESVRDHTTERAASSLLQSLGLLQASNSITTTQSYEIPDSFLRLKPGTKTRRPLQQSPIANLLVAGAWTDTGWPPNLESAIVSGERCADTILERAGF